MSRILALLLTAILLLAALPSSGKAFTEIKDAKTIGDTLSLPQPSLSGSVSLEEVLLYRRSIKLYKDRDLTLDQVSQLLWACQGITEEKKKGRTAPSAGASYPLEVYVLWHSYLWHYLPETHSLELKAKDLKREEVAAAAYAQRPIMLAPACFFIGAVYSRTEHHYGERALRFVPMEAGHACQNLLLQAIALDLGGVSIGGFVDEEVKEYLKFAEDESPLYIVPIGHPHPPRKRKSN